jgi:hypothetical protein
MNTVSDIAIRLGQDRQDQLRYQKSAFQFTEVF